MAFGRPLLAVVVRRVLAPSDGGRRLCQAIGRFPDRARPAFAGVDHPEMRRDYRVMTHPEHVVDLRLPSADLFYGDAGPTPLTSPRHTAKSGCVHCDLLS